MSWYQEQMKRMQAKKPDNAIEAKKEREPPPLEEWLESQTKRQAPVVVKPQQARTRKKSETKYGIIPAQDAWLIFRVVEGADGPLVENVRVARGEALRAHQDEPRDWDVDVPLLDPAKPDETPQQAWQRFVLRWQFRPRELVDALRAAAAIEGLDWLMQQADYFEDANNLKG